MADAWGGSWALSWGMAWGFVEAPTQTTSDSGGTSGPSFYPMPLVPYPRIEVAKRNAIMDMITYAYGSGIIR
jgi:hypothetical protein